MRRSSSASDCSPRTRVASHASAYIAQPAAGVGVEARSTTRRAQRSPPPNAPQRRRAPRAASHTPASLRSAPPRHSSRDAGAHVPTRRRATARRAPPSAAATPQRRHARATAPAPRAARPSTAKRAGGIGVQPARQRPPHRRRHARRARARSRLPSRIAASQLGERLAGEGPLAVQRLEQRDAEAELIGARVGRRAAQLLGRHVRRRADDRAGRRQLAVDLACGDDAPRSPRAARSAAPGRSR